MELVVRSALKSCGKKPPELVLLLKDHKKLKADGSHTSRPVCLASDSPNGPLTNVLSMVVDGISDSLKSTYEVKNTENVCKAIKQFNDTMKDNKIESVEDVQFVSLDAIALYPSLRLEEVCKIVYDMTMKSPVIIESLDWKEIGKYLAVKVNKW